MIVPKYYIVTVTLKLFLAQTVNILGYTFRVTQCSVPIYDLLDPAFEGRACAG